MKSMFGAGVGRIGPTAAVVMATLAGFGCREVVHRAADPVPPPDFQVTAAVSETLLERGGTIDLHLRIESLGAGEAVWGHGSSGCRFTAWALLEGELVPLGPGRMCTMDMREYRLAAGEAYEATLSLDGTVLVNRQYEELPAGEYDVVGGHGNWLSAPVHITIVD